MDGDEHDDRFDVKKTRFLGRYPAKRWAERVERRRNIFLRLKRVGTLSTLGLTSILTGFEDDPVMGWVVKPLEEHSNWKAVFKDSYMYRTNSRAVNKAVMLLPKSAYQRAEEAFRSFSVNLCISVQNEEDFKLITNLNDLKRWCYRTMTSESGVDRICSYLKWVNKSCQAIFLQKEALPAESWFPTIRGRRHPFKDAQELNFLGLLFDSRRISLSHLTQEQVESLVQLANGVRSLPYPSKTQTQESIDKVVDILAAKPRMATRDVVLYRLSLQQVTQRLGKLGPEDTHVSLTTSACYEETQANGGKGAALIDGLRELLGKEEPDLSEIEGLRDHIGAVVFQPGISSFYKPGVKLYNLAYLPLDKAEEYLTTMREGEPPYEFGMSLLLTASWMIAGPAGLGRFEGRIENKFDIPLFLTKGKFRLESGPIPVRASVVLERGMKTRLVTAGPAAKALLEQAAGHIIRGYLSRDKFLKVGFEESDKLWTVLKDYHKEWAKTHPKTR